MNTESQTDRITQLPDGSAFFTSTVLSKEEAMALPLKERPLCFRISSEIYHAVFEAIGAASMCWKPRPGNEVFSSEEASKVAVDLCFKIANEIEDRITQLEASCAAMRESLLRIEKFEEEWGPHSLTAWNEVVATCKQSLSSTDAGKSLLDRITQLEAACAAMREALTDPTRLTITGGVVIPGDALNKALSTSAGKAFIERLQEAEAELEAANQHVKVLRGQLQKAEADNNYAAAKLAGDTVQIGELEHRLQAVEKERDLYRSALEKLHGFGKALQRLTIDEALQPKDALPVDNEGSMARRAAQGGRDDHSV